MSSSAAPACLQELKERQETPDSPEALACIPSLQLSGEHCCPKGPPVAAMHGLLACPAALSVQVAGHSHPSTHPPPPTTPPARPPADIPKKIATIPTAITDVEGAPWVCHLHGTRCMGWSGGSWCI